MSRAGTQQALRQMPVKWALVILALLVTYALAQPQLNSRFGWKLPSIARLLGEPEPRITKDHAKSKPTSDSADAEKETSTKSAQKPTASKKRTAESEDDTQTDTTNSAETTNSAAKTLEREPTNSTGSKRKDTTSAKKADASPGEDNLLYGILRDTGGRRYLSAGGLQYNPGSEEGHRLKHIERHLVDDPDRPGKHGVFDGDMPQVLRWIDDGYGRAKRGAKGVRKTEEDGRTVYEIPFDKPIGYIGGRDGQRSGNPPAKRLRLVLDDTRVITAFPF